MKRGPLIMHFSPVCCHDLPRTWAEHLIPGLIFFLGNYNT